MAAASESRQAWGVVEAKGGSGISVGAEVAMRPILFLDIDGVLVPYAPNTPSCHQFHPRCVEELKSILATVPWLRVVFSTTWRLPQHVNALHEQWTHHGFPEGLAIDGTPDLREDTSVPGMHRRGHEIRAWLESNPDVTRWAVIDDERSGIELLLGADRCVFTDPARGLTADDVERAVGMLGIAVGSTFTQ